MRFALLLTICAVIAPILAAPMPGRKPGTNVKEKEAHEVPDANPGDIVLAQAKDFMGADKGKGSSKNKIHPAIVVDHNPNTHIVHVAAIGHKHPGGVPTMPGKDLGLPETPEKTADPSLVSLGPPKAIKHENLMKVQPLPEGSSKAPLPASIEPGHLDLLRAQIGV